VTYQASTKVRQTALTEGLRAVLRHLIETPKGQESGFQRGQLDAARIANPVDINDANLVTRVASHHGWTT
jgi:hypothetical protein